MINIENLIVGMARSHLVQCEKGRDMDHAVDFGEFSNGLHQGEQEAVDLLSLYDPDPSGLGVFAFEEEVI